MLHRRPYGNYPPIVRGGIRSLVALQVAAAQLIPARFGIRPEKSASRRLSQLVASFRRGKGVLGSEYGEIPFAKRRAFPLGARLFVVHRGQTGVASSHLSHPGCRPFPERNDTRHHGYQTARWRVWTGRC
jgi:hypothetical protein